MDLHATKTKPFTHISNLGSIGPPRFYWDCRILIIDFSYSANIDMWSLGCIASEIFLGLPLFPGTSEYNQICRIIDIMGMPPTHMCTKGKSVHQFMTQTMGPDHNPIFTIIPMEKYMKVIIQLIARIRENQSSRRKDTSRGKHFQISSTRTLSCVKDYPMQTSRKKCTIDVH